MTRSRWFVTLGSPLLMIAAGSAALAAPPPPFAAGSAALAAPPPPTAAVSPPGLWALGRCPESRPAGSSRSVGPEIGARSEGSWWRRTPTIASDGELTGWTVTMGLGSAPSPTAEFVLAPASLVSGPANGRIVVATEDAGRSSVEIVDIEGRCRRSLDVGPAVARQAVAEPSGDGVLVHLIDRPSRRDLGIWRVSADHPPTLVLTPPEPTRLAQAGISKVWSTDLRPSIDGARLAVQSCDPERCLTRLLDIPSGRVSVVSGEQGALIGISGDRLITMGSCPGLPCPVISWDPDTGAGRTISLEAIGAVIGTDGRLVVGAPGLDGEVQAFEVDGSGAHELGLGSLDGGRLPWGGPGAAAGIETPTYLLGLIGRDGQPTALAIVASATTSPRAPPHSPTGEVKP